MLTNRIAQTNQTASIQQTITNTAIYQQNQENTTKATSTTTDTATISSAGQASSDADIDAKWQAIAKKYDVTNITGHEVLAMAQELYDNNFITGAEKLDMYIPAGIDDDLSRKRNHLESRMLDYEAIKKHGEYSQGSLKADERVIEILKRIG
ncbi:hypothetical protein [Thalassotalea euphylliae]|uniref:Uncharacterized protein n=1 Tax=Thalassotalea euphylliae TaxID=1655234 RepID=A0A3E0UD99_9GAMM|nr:hypothetical protein [Thalassotalea euphylliae]REL34968.1 hypothetical protein DXX92_06075 [Thalassotalea euphylliae]